MSEEREITQEEFEASLERIGFTTCGNRHDDIDTIRLYLEQEKRKARQESWRAAEQAINAWHDACDSAASDMTDTKIDYPKFEDYEARRGGK